MKDCKDEMLFVTIYADTITLYSERMWNDLFLDENMIELYFPRSIVEEWYVHSGLDKYEGKDWKNFDDWFYNESTCDGTDGLFNYAMSKGFTPELPPSKWSAEKDAWVWDVGEDGESVGKYWIYEGGRKLYGWSVSNG